jgi:hypothetical protein
MVELRAGMKMSWVATGRAAAQEQRSYAAPCTGPVCNGSGLS